MQKIKIRLPATVTNIGPGLRSLGLALGMYTTVEISGRDDNDLRVVMLGEGAKTFSTPLKNPVVQAMSRFFQRLERTKLGINIRIDNQIPLNSGLGAESALTLAGVLGANNVMGDLYSRDEVLELAAHISRPDGVVAALMGGLAVGTLDDDDILTYRSLPVKPFQVVVVVPQLEVYSPASMPEQIPQQDAIYNISRIPLLIEAFRQGDMRLLAQSLDDRLYLPRLTSRISGYGHVSELAKRLGALRLITCGDGPALMAIVESRPERVAEEMALAFRSAGIEARAWVLPIDTQGVVISFAQSV